MHASRRAAAGCFSLLVAATGVAAAATADSPQSHARGEWTMAAGDYANTRYADLNQITADNAKDLKLVQTFSTGALRGHEAAPLIVGSTLYLITPYPNVVHALDLTKPGIPSKWKFEPKPLAASQGVACCDVVSRGLAYANGRLFMNTLDNQTIAIDAATGKEVWRARLGDINRGESITMAPLVVKDKVLVGNSGGEFGVRGWLTALDAATGKIAWRAYSTGPDKDVLIGPDFKPHYKQDQGTDLGVKTWPPEAWKIGGGTVWGFVSYDPAADLIYYGTANPGPWNPAQRPGDNKWTSGVFARKPDTGAAVWYYQFSPHDLYDYDGINEMILADVPFNGASRKVLMHPDRNGYMYVLDRVSGEVLSARPFVPVTTSKGVNLETGRIQYAPEKDPKVGQTIRDVCPGAPGAKDWQPAAYSPRTQLVYLPHQNICQDMQASDVSYIAGTPYVGMENRFRAGPGGHRGVFTAWDPAAGKKRWSVEENFPVWSGALVTAGDVVFYGTMEGWFKALDAKTGKLLWQYRTGSGIVGQPVSYQGPDGKQYVAVLSGVGGWAGAIVSGDLDARDANAAGGWGNVMKDLPQQTTKGGMLYVFALP